jgi:hypothetical protein
VQPTRTEVETLNARISKLMDLADVAMEEITKLGAENWELKRRLHRKWNGRKHVWRCPTCGGYATLIEAALDINDQILYVWCHCSRCKKMVRPSPGYTIDDIKAALPREDQ